MEKSFLQYVEYTYKLLPAVPSAQESTNVDKLSYIIKLLDYKF